MIRIGVTGQVVSGKEQGRYIRVEEDPSGFIVISSPRREFEHGDEGVYDNWVATRDDLALLWGDREWEIKWFE